MITALNLMIGSIMLFVSLAVMALDHAQAWGDGPNSWLWASLSTLGGLMLTTGIASAAFIN